jgi:RNA polymerase sigma factor (sigma-70 family)
LDAFRRELSGLLPRLRRLAKAITRDPTAADDLVQNAIERALQAEAQWRPGTRMDSWIIRIMKNAWIDEMRSKARRAMVLTPSDGAESVADPSIASAEHWCEAQSLSKAMNALPQEQQIAVALVLVYGLSYREAAEVLEIPVGTLTSRMVRGRLALQAMLQH